MSGDISNKKAHLEFQYQTLNFRYIIKLVD